MAKLLDFAHWKLKSLDPDRAHLEHKDGHQMSISVQSLPKLQQEQIKRLKLVDGGEVKKEDQNLVKDSEKAAAPAPAQVPNADLNEGAGQAAVPATQTIGTPDYVPAAEANADPGDVQQKIFQPAVNQEAAATTELGNIAGQQAQGEAKSLKKQIKSQEDLVADNQKNIGELGKHTTEFSQYIQKHPIDPNHYLESRSTAGKVATGIGLLLGGFAGQGRNPAMDFLNKQIDRDVEAQRANADNQKNVWGAYQQLYGDQKIATELALVTQRDILANKILLTAKQLGTPKALAEAQLHIAELNKANGLSLGVAAQRKTAIDHGLVPREGHEGADERHSREKLEKYGIKPLLAPGAAAKFKKLQNYDPTAKVNQAKLQEEYEGAAQVDKLLNTLPDVFESLSQNASRLTRLADTGENIPYVGKLTHIPAQLTASGRDYESAKSALAKDIANALSKTNVGSDAIQHTVDANVPVIGDPPDLVRKKLQRVAEFIRNSVRSGLLKDRGITQD